MSIATDLTRIQTAKADLKTAIEGKGVTVPSATKIDGYADLVDAIQTGGGGGGSKETGSFVVSGASVRSFTISVTAQHTHVQVAIHGLTGSTDLSTAPYGANHLIYVCMDDTLKIYTSVATNYDGKNTTAGLTRGFPDDAFGASSITSGNISVSGSTRYMVDGATYDWEAW